MMLYKLSLRNIRKSIKDYIIYFFTLVLGIAIFYVFNSLDSQTVMMNVTSSTKEIIRLMTNILSGVSVVVSFILGFLIIYATRFLIKRRNQEFGIYLTLGMSKRKISLILFFETLFIGLISLVIGLGLGVILAQLFSLLVVNMFDADLTKFTFVFSMSACMKTLVYFGIIYLLVMVFNVISISRCKLIDLILGSKKSEKLKLKNPLICIIIFIIAVAMLGYAYFLVTKGFTKLDTADKIFIPIIIGVIATFLIFWSISGLLLKIFMSRKKAYYKGLNSFILRQVSSKINTTVFSMSIICLMLFFTICILSSSLSLKNSMTKNIFSLAPIDVELGKSRNIKLEDYQDFYSKEAVEDSNISIKKTLENLNIDIEKYFKDTLEVNIYRTPDFTLKDSLQEKIEELQKNYKFLSYDQEEEIMKISDYNKVAKLYGNKTYTLKSNQYMVLADFKSMKKIRDQVLMKKPKLFLFGYELVPKYSSCKEGFVEISSTHINSGIILVSDEVVDDTFLKSSRFLANYKEKNKKKRWKVEEELVDIINQAYTKKTGITLNTKLDITEASVGLGAMVTFIGLYLGIIFLISSAAILALKELSESSDNKLRFEMLRKIGVDEKDLNKALFKQIGIFFLFPLIIAIIHSIFGIQFCMMILETFGNDQLLLSIVMTVIFLVFIYGGYFLITYFCSKNIIK